MISVFYYMYQFRRWKMIKLGGGVVVSEYDKNLKMSKNGNRTKWKMVKIAKNVGDPNFI